MIHFFISFFHFFSSHKDPLMDDVWVTSVIMHTHFAANCLLYCYWWLHFQKKWFQEDYYLRPFLSIERKGGEKSLGFYQNSSQDFCMRCDWLMSHLRPKVGIVDKRSLKVLNDDCIQQLQPPTPPPPLFFSAGTQSQKNLIEMQSIVDLRREKTCCQTHMLTNSIRNARTSSEMECPKFTAATGWVETNNCLLGT